ncbi:MAG: bifunctional enoyl-CoA hydratase/phosphate acetyltransferase [Deltaproteobacteria bacterium]|jgi:phosphate butyryltransferase|nr:bifunctional enoyl-CoA hydratase/phosphate acetyltransferase [Deltaproteobacteria bacterium]
MEIKDFKEVLENARRKKASVPMAVAAAEDLHTLEAALKAYREKIVLPYLVGDKKKIVGRLRELGGDLPDELIVEADDGEDAARASIRLIREGRAAFLMKGNLETSQILKALLDKENGLGMGRTLTHMSLTHLPGYRKILAITDAAILISPTLEQKRDVVANAVQAFRDLGYERPQVAVLAAVEKVNPKMPETVDAAELKKMWEAGEIGGCDLEGPISMDLAMNREAAEIKGYKSSVTGSPDILVMPNLVSGNILSKALREFADSTTVGVVMGASVPMVLTSRGASVRSKYTSIALVSQMSVYMH